MSDDGLHVGDLVRRKDSPYEEASHEIVDIEQVGGRSILRGLRERHRLYQDPSQMVNWQRVETG